MRRVILALALLIPLATSCGTSRIFSGRDANQATAARDSAAYALRMTSKSAVAFMRLAGAAYQAGAWGAPGSPHAEDVRDKLSAESVRLAGALEAWANALEAHKDTGPYSLVVETALAVVTALLPPGATAADMRFSPAMLAPEQIADLSRPDTFFLSRQHVAIGGAL